MPLRKPRNLHEEFPALFRFIEAELTDDNWRKLVEEAAKSPPRGRRPSKQVSIEFFVPNLLDIWDIEDLGAARAIQARFRRELKDPHSCDRTRVSHRLNSNFDSLKETLTRSPIYVKENQDPDGIGEVQGKVFRETVKRVCEGDGCERTFIVPRSSPKHTCGDDACRIDASNARKKRLRETS